MNAPEPQIHLPPSWVEALAAARERRRVLVLGATDVGKTTFISTTLSQGPAKLIDLDPGQKMIGAPGTVGRGDLDTLERFIFVGTTSASAFSAIAAAAEELSDVAKPFIVNTAGFVKGIGARLQLMTARAIQPDLIIEIGSEPILDAPASPLIRIEASPFARRKSPASRRRLRQAALERELEGADVTAFQGVNILPAPPMPWNSAARPICSLADEHGEDMVLGVIEGSEEDTLHIRARAAPRPVRIVRRGKMWAEPSKGQWLLRDRLEPSWA